MKFIRKVEEVEVFTYEVKAVEEFIEEGEEYTEEVKEVVEEVENPKRTQCLQNWSVPTLTSPENLLV